MRRTSREIALPQHPVDVGLDGAGRVGYRRVGQGPPPRRLLMPPPFRPPTAPRPASASSEQFANRNRITLINVGRLFVRDRLPVTRTMRMRASSLVRPEGLSSHYSGQPYLCWRAVRRSRHALSSRQAPISTATTPHTPK